MADQLHTSLYGVERQALTVLKTEHQKYQESQVLTPSYVQLMRATHDMLMKGAQRRSGLDIANKSPREILVELTQLVSEFQELVDQQNEAEAAGQLQ